MPAAVAVAAAGVGGRVRFGLTLPRPAGGGLLDPIVAEAETAERAGFDLVWIDAGAGRPPAGVLAAAAALAPHLRGIAVGAVVEVAGRDPVRDVDDLAVADQLLDGRLVTCLRPAPGAEDRFAEAVDRVLGSPTTAQIEPVVWVTGEAGRAAAVSHGLSYVAGSDADGAAAWPAIEAALGRRALRLRRPAHWPVVPDVPDVPDAGGLDVHAMVAALAAAQRSWGLDTAIIRLPDLLDAAGRGELIWRIAHDVRPRVQLDRLPVGLAEYWDERMAARLAGARTSPLEPTRPTGGDDG